MTKKKRIDDREYWFCVIGPVRHRKLVWGADFPLRTAVKNAFSNTFLETRKVECCSGWGVTCDAREAIRFARYDDELKQAVIGSYHDEGKSVPRHMRAWELLFAEEAAKPSRKKTKHG